MHLKNHPRAAGNGNAGNEISHQPDHIARPPVCPAICGATARFSIPVVCFFWCNSCFCEEVHRDA